MVILNVWCYHCHSGCYSWKEHTLNLLHIYIYIYMREISAGYISGPKFGFGACGHSAKLIINLYLGCFSRCTVTSAQWDCLAIPCLAHPEQHRRAPEGNTLSIHLLCTENNPDWFCSSFLKGTCPISWQTLTCVICLLHHRQQNDLPGF